LSSWAFLAFHLIGKISWIKLPGTGVRRRSGSSGDTAHPGRPAAQSVSFVEERQSWNTPRGDTSHSTVGEEAY